MTWKAGPLTFFRTTIVAVSGVAFAAGAAAATAGPFENLGFESALLLTFRKVKQHLSIVEADWQTGLFEEAA
jgi:hypothetical protein